MSVPRLTFLYPHLFRSLRVCETGLPKTHLHTLRNNQHCTKSRPRKRDFSTSERKPVPEFVQRHGKAVEPFIPEGQSSEDVKVFTPEDPNQEKKPENTSSAAPLSEETQAAAYIPGDDGREVIYENVPAKEETTPKSRTGSKDPAGPIETVLRMPAPESQETENANKPPHLQTPPYVHHFDTYTLVQQVEAGGFTMEQSITAMKAVRGLLALNLDVAKEGLVSKSDVENVSFIFEVREGRSVG